MNLTILLNQTLSSAFNRNTEEFPPQLDEPQITFGGPPNGFGNYESNGLIATYDASRIDCTVGIMYGLPVCQLTDAWVLLYGSFFNVDPNSVITEIDADIVDVPNGGFQFCALNSVEGCPTYNQSGTYSIHAIPGNEQGLVNLELLPTWNIYLNTGAFYVGADSMTIKYHSTAKAKLIASVNGVPIGDSGGSLSYVPTIKACGTGSYANPPPPVPIPVQIQCVNAADPTQSVTGCQFLLDLSQGPNSGGHNHNLGDDSRPFVLDVAPANFPTGQFLPVDTNGSSLVYVTPEVSGDVFLEITGMDARGNQINGPSYTFHVQSSLALLDLNGTGMTNNNPGISIVTDSHPGEGTFGTSSMQATVSNLVEYYYENGDQAGFTNLEPLTSQAATMVEGGLFDANWNGGVYKGFLTPWVPPHCGHRDGQTIDLSINKLDADEQGWLKKAAKDAGFVFTAPGERPGDVSTINPHWHATLGLAQ